MGRSSSLPRAEPARVWDHREEKPAAPPGHRRGVLILLGSLWGTKLASLLLLCCGTFISSIPGLSTVLSMMRVGCGSISKRGALSD